MPVTSPPAALLIETNAPRLFENWAWYRWQTFAACWLLYAAYYCCRRNLNVALPLMAQAGYTQLELANLLFVFGLAYAIGQFIAGTLVDRFGGKQIAFAGALLSSLCSALVAVRPDGHALTFLQICNGLGQGCGWSSMVFMLAAWFHRRERGRVMAWWGTSYVLGGFLATTFASIAAVQFIFFRPLSGWQTAFIAPAGILLVAAICFVALARTRPADYGLPSESDPTADISPQNPSWLALLRDPNLLALSGMYFFLKVTRYSLLYWLPLYLAQRMQYSQSRAAFLASLFEGLGFIGILIAGYVSDDFLNSRRYPVGVAMLLLLAFVLLLHPMLGALGPLAMAASISLLGILIHGPDLLIAGSAVADAVPLMCVGRAAGLVNGIGSLGQLISAYVVVAFVNRFGWDQLFNLFLGCTLAGAALLSTRWAAERRHSTLIHSSQQL